MAVDTPDATGRETPSASASVLYKIGDLGHVTCIDDPQVWTNGVGDASYACSSVSLLSWMELPMVLVERSLLLRIEASNTPVAINRWRRGTVGTCQPRYWQRTLPTYQKRTFSLSA